MSGAVLLEMIRLSSMILILAIDTADERTRHLTDHIYHIVTFAALVLCKLVYAYGSRLREANEDVTALDNLVVGVIDWLRSIGLPCHAAHMLGDIISAQFKKLRPDFVDAAIIAMEKATRDKTVSSVVDYQSLPPDIATLYPDFIGSELYIAEDATNWPQWADMYSETNISM